MRLERIATGQYPSCCHHIAAYLVNALQRVLLSAVLFNYPPCLWECLLIVGCTWSGAALLCLDRLEWTQLCTACFIYIMHKHLFPCGAPILILALVIILSDRPQVEKKVTSMEPAVPCCWLTMFLLGCMLGAWNEYHDCFSRRWK